MQPPSTAPGNADTFRFLSPRLIHLVAGLLFVTAGAAEKPSDAKPSPNASVAPRAMPQNPADRSNAPTSSAPAAPEKDDWKVYRHTTGFTLRHPADWTPTPTAVGLQLVPSNQATNAAGATEAYLVLADGAQGITSPEDPRVTQYLDLRVAQLMPFLRRTREPLRVTGGAQLTWEGISPLGIEVRANVFVTILKSHAVALLALGDKNQIARRDEEVRRMFSSFAIGAGERDPALAGAWRFWGYSSSSDGKYGTTVNRQFVIQPDGTCYWNSASESSGNFRGTNSLGETTWSGGLASQNNSGVSQGQWSAARGELFVIWADGSSSRWNYQVGQTANGRRLLLQGANGKADEWVEMR